MRKKLKSLKFIKIRSFWAYLREKYHFLLRKRITRLQIAKETWLKNAQSGEFEFHRTNLYRPSGEFYKDNQVLFRKLGFTHTDYINRMVVDAGCGSMLRTRFFKNARIVGIDPLIDKFKTIDWSNDDLSHAWKLYSLPLEENISELGNMADLVISINVLDHCFDFSKCVDNLYYYLKYDGLCFISFDERSRGADLMHPLNLTRRVCDSVFKLAGFDIKRFSVGRVYGEGTRSLNYWLMKRRGSE